MPGHPAGEPPVNIEQELFIGYVANALGSALRRDGFEHSQADAIPAVRSIVVQSSELDRESLRELLERAHVVRGLTTLHWGGEGPLKSRRWGNIVLNYRSLASDAFLASPTLPGATLIQEPVFRTLTFLLVVGILTRSAIKSMNVELSSRHARVLWILFSNQSGPKGLSEVRLLALVNKDLVRHKQQTILASDLKAILADLSGIRCIREVRGGTWIVCDKVTIVPRID